MNNVSPYVCCSVIRWSVDIGNIQNDIFLKVSEECNNFLVSSELVHDFVETKKLV